MSLPEALLDLSDAAHQARRAGHSETEVARAAGIPERKVAHAGDIVERILRRPVSSLNVDDREWWLVTVGQVLAFAADPRECHCPKVEP